MSIFRSAFHFVKIRSDFLLVSVFRGMIKISGPPPHPEDTAVSHNASGNRVHTDILCHVPALAAPLIMSILQMYRDRRLYFLHTPGRLVDRPDRRIALRRAGHNTWQPPRVQSSLPEVRAVPPPEKRKPHVQRLRVGETHILRRTDHNSSLAINLISSPAYSIFAR